MGLFKPTPLQREIAKKASVQSEDYREVAQEIEYITEDLTGCKLAWDDETRAAIKKAFDNWTLKFDPDDWGRVVMEDPYLPPWHKVVSTSIPLVASIQKRDSDIVTVGDVARTTYNMGLGALIGAALGGTASLILGLPSPARNFFIESGKLAGLVKTILNPIKS